MSEWTAQIVTDMGGTNDWQVANEIATAHNAALAAEREQGVKALMERSFELHECQKQLAAAETAADEFFHANGILTQQLVAERGKVQALVDALKRIATYECFDTCEEAANIAKAGLEKLKRPTF